MALFAVARQRWSERWQPWWEEYYTDNPIVWALQRDIVVYLRERTGDMQLRVLPLWSRARTLWAIAWWTLALVLGITLTLYLQAVPGGIPPLKQVLGRPGAIWLLFVLSTVGSFAYPASVAGFLQTMRSMKQQAALGLTRLRGTHLVYGCLLNSVVRGTLPRAMMGYLPLLWVLYAVPEGAWLWGLSVAVGSIVAWVSALTFFHLLVAAFAPVAPPVQESGAGRQTTSSSEETAARVLGMLLFLPVFITPLSWGNAVWFVAAVMAILCVPVYRAALRRAELALRSKEPVIVPSEGRWQ